MRVDYYVRFEQGRAENVSDEVLDAIASALRLNRDEHGHLCDLVRAVSGRWGWERLRAARWVRPVGPVRLRGWRVWWVRLFRRRRYGRVCARCWP
ncbi:hypothetical protein ACIBSV_05260 [Embleya sp. NPDC050154]|uniref:hypothetical protein n=1 Tax=Embleya sp. NPDC050154 TaxID=3363988 RepID=UPI0037BBE8AF